MGFSTKNTGSKSEGQTGDVKSEHWHFRNQWTKKDWNGVNLIQMTIISTTMGKNPLEEME